MPTLRPLTQPRTGCARSASGFTLMELLVVLVLVAVIVALAPPLWSNAVPAAEHRAAAGEEDMVGSGNRRRQFPQASDGREANRDRAIL